jgi:hypothetical protein
LPHFLSRYIARRLQGGRAALDRNAELMDEMNDRIERIKEGLQVEQKKILAQNESLIKQAKNIKDIFKNSYFLLEKAIPLKIKGVVIMDRINLLTSVQHLDKLEHPKIKELYKIALDSTVANAELIKKDLLNIKSQLKEIEKFVKNKNER